MKRFFRYFSLLLLVFALMVTPVLAANTFTGTSLAVPGGFNSGYLMGIWGMNQNDLHAVGFVNNGTNDFPLAYHYDGSNWTSNNLVLPAGWVSGGLRAVWGTSSSNVYAAGFGMNSGVYSPLLYQYDGANWTHIPMTVPGGWSNTYLYGIWGTSTNNVYVTGYGYTGTNYTPLIYHFDGSNWTSTAPAMPGGWSYGALYQVGGSAANDIYTVGSGYDGTKINTLIYHFDGTNWTSTSPGVPGSWDYGYLWGVWSSGANNVYAFGGGTNATVELPLIYFYDGIDWSYYSPSLPSGWNYGYLFSGWGTGPSDVYAIGYGYDSTWNAAPLIYHFDGSSWSHVALTLPGGITQGQLWAAGGLAANSVFAAGYGYDGANLVPLVYRSLDNTTPVVTVPADKTVEATSAAGAVVTFAGEVSATDDVLPSNPSVSCNPASGSTFALGTTNVDCQATDASNNTGHSYFNITVQDTTAPSMSPSDITVPQTLATGAVVNYVVTAADAVDATPTVNCAPVSGSTFPVGTTTVNCTATDDYSNSSNASFEVTVVGENLLDKGDFTNINIYPAPWQPIGFKPPYITVMDCSYFVSSPCAVTFSAGNRAARQRVLRNGFAGDMFSFGIHSAASNVPAGGAYRVELTFYNSRNQLVGSAVINIPIGSHDFTRYQADYTVPADYRTIYYRFSYQKSSGRAWFDDAFLYFVGP